MLVTVLVGQRWRVCYKQFTIHKSSKLNCDTSTSVGYSILIILDFTADELYMTHLNKLYYIRILQTTFFTFSEITVCLANTGQILADVSKASQHK